MHRVRSLVFAGLALLLVFASPAAAQTTVAGRDAGGAYFLIVVPNNWNGDLVLWNHGFSLTPPAPLTLGDLGPLGPLQLSQGYAVAASSYRQTGWALFDSNEDLEHLYNTFVGQFGPPGQVFIFGASLGGIVTISAVERAHVGNVVGALTICGAVAGSRNWDGALDLRLVYDAVCGGVPGAAIPGGAKGLPAGSTLTSTDVALRVNACTGVLMPPAGRTPEQQQRLETILAVAQIPESFVITDMVYVTFGMGDLVNDPTKLNGRVGTGNADVDYEDDTINESIERVTPRPKVERRLRRHYSPTGRVGRAKLVSMHTSLDGLVLVENERELQQLVPPAQLTTAIVAEATPTHCGFTGAEILAGWESLRLWVAGAPQPTAQSIQATCTAVAPLVGGPCRIDPAFKLKDLDTRVRPR